MSETATAVAPTDPAAPADRRPLDVSAMEDHRGRLYRAAYALTGTRHDAEDLVQDTFERILRRPRFVRRDRDLAYLLRALRHTWAEQSKTAARRQTHPAPPEDFQWLADHRADQELASEARGVYAAMADLTEPQRLAVVAVDVVGLSYKEAARVLGTRRGTIMSRLFRAREALAVALEST